MKIFKKSLSTLSKMMGFVFLLVAFSSISVKGQTILSEGFENPQSSWNSYTTDTLGFTSGPWSLVEVFPENGARVYQGSKAARINDDEPGASVTTPALDSVGTVSFYYVRPFSGAGEFVLQKSVAGAPFTSLDTVNYTNDTLPNFSQYSYDINDASQNIRVRVLNDDNTAQLSVDEFEVKKYSGGSSGGNQSTAASIPYFEDFENDSLNGWRSYSILSNANWSVSSFGGDFFAEINGFGADTNSNDWLISPRFDISNIQGDVYFSFFNAKNFSGGDFKIKVSNDYDGTSNPDSNQFTWNDVTSQVALSTGNYQDTFSGYLNLAPYQDDSVYIAYHYTSSPSSAALRRVDDVKLLSDTNAIPDIRFAEVWPDSNKAIIKNYGHFPYDISGWQLCANFNYNAITSAIVQQGDLMLKPGEEVTITWNNITASDQDLGLYNSNNFSDTAAMEDFLQWGSAGNGRESVADNKGIWTAGNFLTIATPYEYVGQGDPDHGVAFWDSKDIGGTTTASIPYFQDFEDGSLDDWTSNNVMSNKNWVHTSFGGDFFAEMSGFQADTNSNDWLISPEFDFTGNSNLVLSFYSAKNFSGGSLDIKISTNYDGTSDPTNSQFSWNNLTSQAALSQGNFNDTFSGEIDVSGYNDTSVYIAFHYTATPDSAATWQIDDIELKEQSQQPDSIIINEILADNQSINTDQNGENDPWVELYNPNPYQVNLQDYSLSDDAAMPSKYTMPDTTIQGNGYLLLWADGDNNQSGLHANFSLNASGGNLHIYDSLQNLMDSVSYNMQNPDTSLARIPDGTGAFKMAQPTPSAENTELPEPQPSASIPYFQDFENGSLEGWNSYNVQSNENWRYDSFEGDHFAEVNGFQADANSNDWLISPEFDFTGFDNLAFSFYSAKNFSGGDFKIKVSTNYDGISDPTNAKFDWTDITAQAELSDSNYIDTYSGLIDVSNINSNAVYFAFHYTSTPNQATLWQIDDIEIQEVEAPDTVKLNELLVNNQATNTDQDDENDPWIELYNPNSDTVNLAGYSLSDNPNMNNQYSLPNTTIQPNDYRIVWADNDTLQAGLHAPFSLDKNGGKLFFYGPQSRLIDSVTYGPQKADTSFARLPNGSGSFEMAKPTPAAKNDSFTTSINEISKRSSFDMYPNPTEDVLNITSDNSDNKKIELFNTQGQIMFRERFNGTKLQLNTSVYESGLYFIKLQNVEKGEIVNKKLIIR